VSGTGGSGVLRSIVCDMTFHYNNSNQMQTPSGGEIIINKAKNMKIVIAVMASARLGRLIYGNVGQMSLAGEISLCRMSSAVNLQRALMDFQFSNCTHQTQKFMRPGHAKLSNRVTGWGRRRRERRRTIQRDSLLRQQTCSEAITITRRRERAVEESEARRSAEQVLITHKT
jgi:hypothetical protein